MSCIDEMPIDARDLPFEGAEDSLSAAADSHRFFAIRAGEEGESRTSENKKKQVYQLWCWYSPWTVPAVSAIHEASKG